MARIRSIKIEFFRDEDLAVFSHAHRLLFEGLWLLADRAGRLEDRPVRIHADLFPFQSDKDLNVDAMLTDLADGEKPFIQRYVVQGRRYISIINFLKHQRPHHTEAQSGLPGPERDDHLNPPEPHGETPELHSNRGDNGEDPAGKGSGSGSGSGSGNGEEKRSRLTATPQLLADAWNEGTTAPIARCQALSQARRRKALSRLRDASIDEWRVVIARINASPFCRGENDRGWVASFDWLLQPDVRLKVLEGKYDGKRRRGTKPMPAYDMAWADECQRLHRGRCGSRQAHAHQLDMDARKAAAS